MSKKSVGRWVLLGIGCFFTLLLFLALLSPIQKKIVDLVVSLFFSGMNVDLNWLSNLIHIYTLMLFGFFLILTPTLFFSIDVLKTKGKRESLSFYKFGYVPDKKTFVAILLIAICLVLLHFVYLFHKGGMHADEAASFIYSNRSNSASMIEEGTSYKGYEMNGEMLYDYSSISDLFSDVGHMWIFTNDDPHTNLYYVLLRLWFIGAEYSSIGNLIIRGGLLNIFILCLCLYFFIALVYKLFDDWKYVLISLPVAFLSTGMISLTLFLRPYQLQALGIIFVSYVFVNIYGAILDGKEIYNYRMLFKAAFAIALALSTGYFILFYVILLGLAIIITLLVKKEHKRIWFWMLVFLLSFLFCECIYLSYFIGFSGSRGLEAASKGSAIIANLLLAIKAFVHLVVHYALYVPVLILLLLNVVTGVCFRRTRHLITRRNLIILILVASSMLWAMITLTFAPYKILRYMMPCIPILMLIIPWVLYNFSLAPNVFAFLYIILMVYGALTARTPVNHEEYEFDNYNFSNNHNVPILLDGPVSYSWVDNLYLDTISVYENLDNGLDCIILNDDGWLINQYLPSNVTYHLYSEWDKIDFNKYECVNIIGPAALDIECAEQYEIGNNKHFRIYIGCNMGKVK